MATATKTTTPRTRAARKPAATKATAAVPAEVTADEGDVKRIKVELEFVDNTKSYAKFGVPDSLKGTMVGNVYVPLGTKRVAILVVGDDDTDE